MYRYVAVVALAVLVASSCGGSGEEADGVVAEVTIAAASDLRPAFDELGAAFTAASAIEVVFSYGSSGQLREQIVHGAPFDLFASANVDFVDAVIAAGPGIESTKADYAVGRIVLWAPPGTLLPSSIEQLASPTYRRIAIANPTHAPYGLAAEQALRSAGVLDLVAERLIYGENISDTFRIAQSGNVDAAIVALSIAIADGSEYQLIPDDLHGPLRQALVVTSSGPRGQAAADFAAFVASPAGRAVMVRYGFVLPGETLPDHETPDVDD